MEPYCDLINDIAYSVDYERSNSIFITDNKLPVDHKKFERLEVLQDFYTGHYLLYKTFNEVKGKGEQKTTTVKESLELVSPENLKKLFIELKAVKQVLKIQDQERLTLQKNNENFTSSIPSTSEIQNHKKEKETA